jgi:hypothetical protein
MKVVVIKSESEYNSVATRLESLTKANPGTSEAQELKLLVKAVADYHRIRR